MSFGPISWLLCGEVFPLKVRRAAAQLQFAACPTGQPGALAWNCAHAARPPSAAAGYTMVAHSGCVPCRRRCGLLTLACCSPPHCPCPLLLLPLMRRGQAIALATLTNFGSNFLVSLLLPSIQEQIGQGGEAASLKWCRLLSAATACVPARRAHPPLPGWASPLGAAAACLL